MAKKIVQLVIEPTNKKTSIGRRNIKTSTMSKNQKRSFKKYRGQG